jgi:hypothetical protein
LKDLYDGAAFALLDHAVEVGEALLVALGQILAHGAFSGPHEADQKHHRWPLIAFQ